MFCYSYISGILVVYSKESSTYVCASVKSVGKKIFNFRHTDFTIYS